MGKKSKAAPSANGMAGSGLASAPRNGTSNGTANGSRASGSNRRRPKEAKNEAGPETITLPNGDKVVCSTTCTRSCLLCSADQRDDHLVYHVAFACGAHDQHVRPVTSGVLPAARACRITDRASLEGRAAGAYMHGGAYVACRQSESGNVLWPHTDPRGAAAGHRRRHVPAGAGLPEGQPRGRHADTGAGEADMATWRMAPSRRQATGFRASVPIVPLV